MTAIFISHNSADAKEAVALKRWLADNGWADVFLDIDAKDGLSPGERWKDALRTAADRCEAVLCLVSPAWLASAECKLEFRYAEQLRKHLFLAIIKPCDPKDLPPDWQWCPLYGDGAQTTLQFEFREQPAECSFLSDGLERLKNGLEKAGISAEHFPWPPANDPDRAPYRGLKPLEAADAAVFFGRNAQTLHGMETLWDMRRTGIERLLVILGASGSGKSSFMRAGLLPRLARDERQFFPLPVIRPRNAVLLGAEGLAPALAAAFAGLGRNLTLGAIEKELNAGAEAFVALLAQLEQWLLERRPLEPIAGEAEPQPPSLVIPIDQAEELFNPDGAAEAAPFLSVLGQLLTDRDPPGMSAAAHRRALVVLTIRSDRYERLQTAPGLSEIKPRLFDLRPFPPSQFERVINGPAERATQAGRKLKIEPRLTERLLADFSEGADTLPLLGFTLEKLYHKYGGDGDLTFEDYESIRGSHETVQAAIFQEAIDSALSEPYRPPPIPAERTEQYQGLRRAFIPFLARINPETNEPMRQVAKMRDLPADVHPLVERLVEARLLIRDKDAIEVAHESLLRQWPSLRGWLTEDRDKLRLLENIRQSAAEWQKENRHEDLLVHRDGRLKDAEALLATPGYVVAADSDERAYLNACTAAQQAREQEKEQRAEAERIAKERELEQAKALAETQRQRADEQAAARVRQRRFSWGLVALLAVAVVSAFYAQKHRGAAEEQRRRAESALAATERGLLRAQSAELRAMIQRLEALEGSSPGTQSVERERQELVARLEKTTRLHQAKLAESMGFRGHFDFIVTREGQYGGVKLFSSDVMIDPFTYLNMTDATTIRKRYEFLLSPDEIAAVLAMVGKQGDAAKAAYNEHRSTLERIRLKPTDVAQLVPEATEYFWRKLLERYPDLKKEDTPGAVHTALLSMAVNIGDRHPAWNSLTPAIADGNWLLLADLIETSMDGRAARLGSIYRAIKRRRVEEANLIRKELGIAENERSKPNLPGPKDLAQSEANGPTPPVEEAKEAGSTTGSPPPAPEQQATTSAPMPTVPPMSTPTPDAPPPGSTSAAVGPPATQNRSPVPPRAG